MEDREIVGLYWARDIYFSRDRQQFTILYAAHDPEAEEPGMYYRGEFDPASGIVLVANAPDYETMIALSGAVGVPYALGMDGTS